MWQYHTLIPFIGEDGSCLTDIAHGDVKAENFLLEQSEEGELNCRLADFVSESKLKLNGSSFYRI